MEKHRQSTGQKADRDNEERKNQVRGEHVILFGEKVLSLKAHPPQVFSAHFFLSEGKVCRLEV